MEYQGYLFQILNVENKMIRSVKVTPIAASEAEGEPQEEETRQ